MNYYTEVLKKYAVFEGRASRAEYWYFFLFSLIIGFALGFIEGFLGIASGSDDSVLANIYYLAVLIPSIAVGVRRMHDVGKSGWFIIIPIYNLLLTLRSGTGSDNKYGPNSKEPKEIDVSRDNIPTPNYCHKCGTKMDEDSKFCFKCGAKVSILDK